MSSQNKAESAARHAGTDYWQQTRWPWPSLVFLLPLLVIYESGVVWLGGRDSTAVRSGADVWLRSWLAIVGLDTAWWPPLLIVLGLLGWQWMSRHPWRVSLETLSGMFAESVLFAFLLVLLGQWQSRLFAVTF